MVRTLILGFGCLAAAGAQTDLTREGSFWVRSVSGTDQIAPAGRLQINASGSIKICGAPQNHLTYVLKSRVKGRGEQEARRRLSGLTVHVTRQGETSFLAVQPGAGMGELDVRVPRTLKETLMVTTDGSLEMCDLDGSVRGRTGGGPIRADRIRGDVRVNTSGGDIEVGTVGGLVQAVTMGGRITLTSAGREANLETAGGDVFVQSVGGPLRVSTGAGGIHIGKAAASVTASTAGGLIQIGEAHGVVTTRNFGGPVQVGAAAGVSCENANGGVRLQNVSGRLRVSTAFGSIIAQLFSGRPITDSFLTTANGDITVLIPSNIAVTIRARNDSADSVRRIVSEFPGVEVRMDGSQVVAEGAINGGGPVLRLAGTGGTIFIKRR